MRFLSSALMAIGLLFAALPGAAANQGLPPGGKYKDCHGYMRHVSLVNARVHCIDGIPADVSFLTWPKFVNLPDGTTMESVKLKPNQPVHVIYSQVIGVRHAYKVYLAKPNGHGLYGFKT